MEEIIIPGYHSWNRNQVYSKEDGTLSLISDENRKIITGIMNSGKLTLLGEDAEIPEIPAARIIVFNSFEAPTKKNVMNYLLKRMNQLNYSSPEENEEEIDALNYLLKQIPEEEVKKILGGDKRAKAHLFSHLPNTFLKEGQRYINIVEGKIPNPDNMAFELMKRGNKLGNSNLYEILMEKTGKKYLDFTIKVEDNGNLIEESELEYILKTHVQKSHSFALLHEELKEKEIAERIRYFYNLFKVQNLDLLKDISEEKLESNAFGGVTGLLGCMAIEQAKEDLVDYLLSTPDKKKEPPHKDYKCDFDGISSN